MYGNAQAHPKNLQLNLDLSKVSCVMDDVLVNIETETFRQVIQILLSAVANPGVSAADVHLKFEASLQQEKESGVLPAILRGIGWTSPRTVVRFSLWEPTLKKSRFVVRNHKDRLMRFYVNVSSYYPPHVTCRP